MITIDDQQAIVEAHRRFAAYLITSSIAIIQNKCSAVSSAYDALRFLQSDDCIYLIRLLGIVNDNVSDDEIVITLIDAHRSRGNAPDHPCDF